MRDPYHPHVLFLRTPAMIRAIWVIEEYATRDFMSVC